MDYKKAYESQKAELLRAERERDEMAARVVKAEETIATGVEGLQKVRASMESLKADRDNEKRGHALHRGALTRLVNIVDPTRAFPPDFDWDDEDTVNGLVDELRVVAETDFGLENERLRGIIASSGGAAAARQKAKSLGLTDEEIEALKK